MVISQDQDLRKDTADPEIHADTYFGRYPYAWQDTNTKGYSKGYIPSLILCIKPYRDPLVLCISSLRMGSIPREIADVGCDLWPYHLLADIRGMDTSEHLVEYLRRDVGIHQDMQCMQ